MMHGFKQKQASQAGCQSFEHGLV